MAESKPDPIPTSAGRTNFGAQTDSDAGFTLDDTATGYVSENAASITSTPRLDAQTSPRLSRNPSFGSSSYQDDWDSFPPLDRLTVLDLLDNFTLPLQLEKLQKGISKQTEKVRKSRTAVKNQGQKARERMVEEWRRRVPSADEQLERYRRRMKTSVEKLGKRWSDTKVITLREKISFICGVWNIFVSGYLMGALPEWFHIWYTVQLLYFMPIRFYSYRKRGYHYFVADLCYFVNLLLFLTLWVFPQSKRMFIAAFCLAFGNNAVAIIMWRNSLVFHDFDKVSTLFIHIGPCATLHTVTHLYPVAQQAIRFPALHAIKTAPPGSAASYSNLISMLVWSTCPYAFWQFAYYIFISLRRREKIAAGRPTSFTWLRKSYSKAWIGKLVLSQPDWLQEPMYMLIQYGYAVLTMLPCPIWFLSKWASSLFMITVFTWSIYNGSTYYIDVFGKRFQKELEKLKAEVAQWQASPDMLGTPLMTPGDVDQQLGASSAGAATADKTSNLPGAAVVQVEDPASGRYLDIQSIPLLSDETKTNGDGSRPVSDKPVMATGVESGSSSEARERKTAT